jgi:radical SAM protein with 4Fe4S-binding SPASM domain
VIDFDFYNIENVFMFEHEKIIHHIKINKNPIKAPYKYEISLTNKCNQKCIHCSNDKKADSTLDTDSLKKILNYEPVYVVLTGGEPLLNDNIFSVIRIMKENNIFIKICTNGVLLNEQCLKELNDSGFGIGDIIQISLDASNKTDYMKIRGTDDYDKVLLNISSAKEKTEALIEVHAVPNKINIRDIKKMYEIANELRVDIFSTAPLAHLGCAHPCQDANVLEIIGLEKILQNESKKYTTKYIGSLFECCQLYGLIDEANVQRSKSKKYKCSAGIENIYIDCDGTCYPCVYLKNNEFELGNINGNFDNVIQKAKRNFNSGISIRDTPCDDCYLWGLCNGGCIGVAFNVNGRLKPGYDDRCAKSPINLI